MAAAPTGAAAISGRPRYRPGRVRPAGFSQALGKAIY
jgi:hypothetical protein